METRQQAATIVIHAEVRFARMRRLYWLLALVVALAFPPSANADFRLDFKGLNPEFQKVTHDYTVRSCDAARPLTVSADGRDRARMGTRDFVAGERTRNVNLAPGQAIRIVRRHAGGERAKYFIRCLPENFPTFTFTRYAAPIDELIVLTSSETPYVFIVDGRGVPVWWFELPSRAFDGKVLADGSIAYVRVFGSPNFATDPSTAYDIVDASGNSLGQVKAPGHVVTDHHELEQADNGNYVLISYRKRPRPVDASAFNNDASARVIDNAIYELTPSGEVVWKWHSQDHIGLSETGLWWPLLSEPYDLVHINGVERLGSGDFLFSARHTDAVYRIDRDTGEIEWKLGGTDRDESLTPVGDPHGDYPLGANHDVRQSPNGGITVFDNATHIRRPPRAVRYKINTAERTATLVDEVVAERVDQSNCCGSARQQGENWIISWGGQNVIESFTAGERDFVLTLHGDRSFSYRANPVDGLTDTAALRRGMNQQVPLLD